MTKQLQPVATIASGLAVLDEQLQGGFQTQAFTTLLFEEVAKQPAAFYAICGGGLQAGCKTNAKVVVFTARPLSGKALAEAGKARGLSEAEALEGTVVVTLKRRLGLCTTIEQLNCWLKCALQKVVLVVIDTPKTRAVLNNSCLRLVKALRQLLLFAQAMNFAVVFCCEFAAGKSCPRPALGNRSQNWTTSEAGGGAGRLACSQQLGGEAAGEAAGERHECDEAAGLDGRDDLSIPELPYFQYLRVQRLQEEFVERPELRRRL